MPLPSPRTVRAWLAKSSTTTATRTTTDLTVSFFDATSAQGAAIAAGAEDGTFIFDPNGQFDGLAVGESATDTFTYTVSDGNGGTDTATVTVSVLGQNDAPTAAAVVAAVLEDATVSAAFAADDVDSDDDATTLTYDIPAQPPGGFAQNNGDGTFTFFATFGFNDLAVGETRDVTFDYQATDSHGSASDPGVVTVTITGVNDTPEGRDDNGIGFNLGSLDGSDGFRMAGTSQNSSLGNSVSDAGDVNGDGVDDFIVGEFRTDFNGYNSGSSYLVFGNAAGFPADFDVATLDGGNGFRIDGESFNDNLGRSVSCAGDVNGDGVDDIIVGAPN